MRDLTDIPDAERDDGNAGRHRLEQYHRARFAARANYKDVDDANVREYLTGSYDKDRLGRSSIRPSRIQAIQSGSLACLSDSVAICPY